MEIQNCIAVEQFTEEIKGNKCFGNLGESVENLGESVENLGESVENIN